MVPAAPAKTAAGGGIIKDASEGGEVKFWLSGSRRLGSMGTFACEGSKGGGRGSGIVLGETDIA